MNPKVVTFDCADTLIDLKWHPVSAVRLLSERLEVPLPDEAFFRFGALFLDWRPQYETANLNRDPEELQGFWRSLYRSWLSEQGHDQRVAEKFLVLGEELSFSAKGPWFRPFSDTASCLARLKEAGYRLAVISNWDISLHRILRTQSLYEMFDAVFASLEEGVEKPDPKLFQIALKRMGFSPDEAVHVGDREDDDVQGAHAAGMRALLLDRKATASSRGMIRSLDELPEALAWSV